jgi:hypothetical protein
VKRTYVTAPSREGEVRFSMHPANTVEVRAAIMQELGRFGVRIICYGGYGDEIIVDKPDPGHRDLYAIQAARIAASKGFTPDLVPRALLDDRDAFERMIEQRQEFDARHERLAAVYAHRDAA